MEPYIVDLSTATCSTPRYYDPSAPAAGPAYPRCCPFTSLYTDCPDPNECDVHSGYPYFDQLSLEDPPSGTSVLNPIYVSDSEDEDRGDYDSGYSSHSSQASTAYYGSPMPIPDTSIIELD